MNSDQWITQILNRIKNCLSIDTDKALAERMNTPLRRLQTWKQRNTVPIKEIVAICEEETLDLNLVLVGKQPTQAPNCLPEKRGVGSICTALPGYICPPKKMLDEHEITSDQIVDPLLLNLEWVQYVLGLTHDKVALIRVIGNNMSPWVSDGDIVILDVTDRTIVNDAPLALLYGSVIVIKRLARHPDGTIIAKSDSHYCEDEVYPPDTEHPPIIGRVVRRIVR